MEAAPSVAFHERAPDLLKEEDMHSTQPGASDAEDMLPNRPWPQHDNAENDMPAQHAQHRARTDICYDPSAPSQPAMLKQETLAQESAAGESAQTSGMTPACLLSLSP